jgi:hypothetical protein
MIRKTLLIALLAAAPVAAQSPAWRLTPEGYGPAQIGMTPAQVSAALSTRLEGEAIEDASVCVEQTATSGYPDLVFLFENGRLARISAVQSSRVATPRGIGVGATAAQVRRAYGPALRAETHQYLGRPAEYLTFWTRPNRRGVRFETDANRRVQTIHAGNAAIRYIEGCA